MHVVQEPLIGGYRPKGPMVSFLSSSVKVDSDGWGFQDQEYLAWQQHWHVEQLPAMERTRVGLRQDWRACPWGDLGTLRVQIKGHSLHQREIPPAGTKCSDKESGPWTGLRPRGPASLLALNRWVASLSLSERGMQALVLGVQDRPWDS